MRRLALIGVALVAVAVVLVKPWSEEPYRLELVFADATGLRVNGDLKVRGVRAGRIEKVELDARDRARVTARLFDGVGPLGAGARARSRPTGPLGETYIDLDQGDGRRPLPSGSVIGRDRTGRYVGLDQVLDTLDSPTRARLRILVNEAGVGLAGRGADLNRLLAALPPSLDETRGLLDQIRDRNDRLRRLIGAGDRVLAAIAPHRDELGALVSHAAGTLEATALNRESLGRAVDEAPGALRQLRATLSSLGATAQRLRPTARRLSASAAPLHDMLAALPGFERDARPTLAAARAAAPAVERFSRRGRAPLRDLAPVTDRLAGAARALGPVLEVLDRGGTAELLRWADGFGQLVERRDSLGHFARLRMVVDQDVLTSAIDYLLGP